MSTEPDVIALQLMPLMIEIIMQGIALQIFVQAIILGSCALLCEGDLCALTWVPLMIEYAITMATREEVITNRPYVTRREKSAKSSWLARNVPLSWKERFKTVTEKGKSFLQDSKPNPRGLAFRYRRHEPAKERKKGRRKNRSFARSLRLIAITCMSAASIEHSHAFDSDSFPIAVDNCSSRSLTNSRKDFKPGTIKPCNIAVMGISGAVKCTMKGTVSWTLEDDQGLAHDFEVEDTPLCTSLPHRLFSPQHWAQQIEGKSRFRLLGRDRPSCSTNADETKLSWGKGRFTKTIRLDKGRNVAVMMTKSGIKKYSSFAAEVAPLEPQVNCFVDSGAPQCSFAADDISEDNESSVDESRQDTESTSSGEPSDANTEGAEDLPPEPMDFEAPADMRGVSTEGEAPLMKELDEMYRLHVRCGHLSFSKIRAMARRGEVSSRLKDCASPICAACQFGKATKKPWRTKAKNRRTLQKVSAPGDCVSVDQIESRAVGFVAQLKGILTRGRYTVVTVFVDHYSRLGYVHLQKDSSSLETLKAKRAFELFCRDNGVKIKHYHADNGRFVDNAWKESLLQENQSITYCGVNAHFQNGIAERRIRDLKEQGRTMILHAQHQWPEAVTTALWPYALRTGNDVFNHAPTLQGERKDSTPYESFTGVKISAEPRHHHTFGCPVYVLANELQQGKTLKAWLSRARVGVNLGISPTHARSVALVLSLNTGLVSPQFHTKHDDLFETVHRRTGGYRLPKSHWQALSGFVKGAQVTLAPLPESPAVTPDSASEDADPPGNDGTSTATPSDNTRDDESLGEATAPADDSNHPQDDDPDPHIVDNASTTASEQHPLGTTTRSGRRVRVTQRARESYEQQSKKWVSWFNDMKSETPASEDDIYEIFAHREYDVQDRASDPIAFSATSDPDTMYWHQAMKGPDKAEFLKAAQEEVKSHVDNKHFVLRKRSDLPKGTKVLDSVWSMKRKRRILTRKVYKWKARLNAHGGQQEHGVNFWETYSPVVNWFSIRLYLVISLLNNWHTRQIDFVLAFPQAKVECDIYMEIPPGFNLKGRKKEFCLKLEKNIYGTKQAGRVWNQHLDKGLKKLGYVPSRIDPCVYYHGTSVLMLYVDDGIFVGPDKSEIDGLIKGLEQEFNITDEGDLKEYLGVLVEKEPGGRLKLSQPQLISQILDALWFNHRTNAKPTPAPGGQVLQRELDAEPMTEDFHYRSVVGQANYLEKSTRLDIAVAVHQCARFSADPKQSHADALRYVGRYLKGSKNEGIYLDPNEDQSFECWVDADFLGQYVKGAPDMHLDKMTAKSRTGFIITYAGCPIVWGSKLQRESALSTTEAEYMAISEAFRSLLPMMDLLEEARSKRIPIITGPPVVHCKAFEDNSGALELARLPKMRPRTKHINVKYHHFREAVAAKRVTILHVPSEDQLGDLLTKNLPRDLFAKLRKRIMGW
jgi:hypothetical protein